MKAVERRKVRHVMDTEPEIITAGSTIDVWYNPKVGRLRPLTPAAHALCHMGVCRLLSGLSISCQ